MRRSEPPSRVLYFLKHVQSRFYEHSAIYAPASSFFDPTRSTRLASLILINLLPDLESALYIEQFIGVLQMQHQQNGP
jgi:hypothetical protein